MPDLPETAASEIEVQTRLASEYRDAAASRAEEITRLLQAVEELTERIQVLETAASTAETAAASISEGEFRRLQALSRRRSVRLILRADSLLGRGHRTTGGANAVR